MTRMDEGGRNFHVQLDMREGVAQEVNTELLDVRPVRHRGIVDHGRIEQRSGDASRFHQDEQTGQDGALVLEACVRDTTRQTVRLC